MEMLFFNFQQLYTQLATLLWSLPFAFIFAHLVLFSCHIPPSTVANEAVDTLIFFFLCFSLWIFSFYHRGQDLQLYTVMVRLANARRFLHDQFVQCDRIFQSEHFLRLAPKKKKKTVQTENLVKSAISPSIQQFELILA